jgi:hypothetical protein
MLHNTASIRIGFVALALFALFVRGVPASQGLPQPSPNAKACAYLPILELEAHFGAKAQNVQGIDQETRFTCSARFPDPFHAAVIESHPSTAADTAMSAAQRLAIIAPAVRAKETRDFGSVGCLRTTVDMGKPVQETTCFLGKAPYLSLSMQSVDAGQVGFDAVKALLEKAAARRK